MKRLMVLLIVLGTILSSPSQAAPRIEDFNKESLYQRSYRAFQKGNYDQAIAFLKKHLQTQPKDDLAWNLLASSYYHVGLPKRALRYLKSVEKKTSQPSYNLYYQGLIYAVLGEQSKAEAAFTAVLPFNDVYASYSVYELGILNYRRKKPQLAHYWLSQYLQRYPQGPFGPGAYRLLQSLQTGEYINEVAGTTAPDMDQALFRYNSLSLFSFPHFWLFQFGSGYTESFGKEPATDPNQKQILKPTQGIEQSIHSTYGLGIGTFNLQGNLLTAGYIYRQLWHTNADRLDIYLEDMMDFEYFAFRPDLMERQHQFFADFRRNLTEIFYFGLYGRLEYARVGSGMFKTSEDSEAQKTLKISDTSLLLPWIGVGLGQDLRLLGYYYLCKELNDDEPAFSNKTYDFSGDQPIFSLGTSVDWSIPALHLNLNVEYFHYEFIFNDIFLDYTRNGFLFSTQYDIWKRLYFRGLFGYYEDQYLAETLRQTSCKTSIQDLNSTEDPKKCRRTDAGMMYELEAYWNYTQFHRFGVKYTHTENSNDLLKQYESEKNSLVFSVTIAFPSVTRVARFTERFADAAFTKEDY
jgi:tetratricopeptide (TPR) repeat protein